MSDRWVFHASGDTIVMRSRIEAGGIVGDAEEHINPGSEIGITGLTYEALKAASPGVLDLADDGTFTITPTRDPR